MLGIRFVLTLTNIVLGFVESIIGLRVLLKLLGASSTAPFVNWVYETSQPLLYPFLGMFPTSSLTGGFVIEISALIGMIAYSFAGYVITEALQNLEYYSQGFRNKKS